MKRFVSIIILVLTPFLLCAQELPYFSNKQLQYAYFNPGYIPELQYSTITLGGRAQWVGLEGMPISAFISAKYFFLGAHSQVGINMLYDHIGYTTTVNPKVDYAFCVPFAPDSYINFGLSAGFMHKSFDFDKIDMGNKSVLSKDQFSREYLESGIQPDIDVGIEFLIQNIEFGFAATHLLPGKIGDVTMNRIFYGFANCNFQSEEWWRLSPTYSFYFFRGDEDSKNIQQHQFGLDFFYVGDYDFNPRDYFYVGAAYKITKEVVVRTGFSHQIFSIFYSYDFFLTDLNRAGSHELGIEFRIGQKDRGCYANYGMSKKRYTRYHRN